MVFITQTLIVIVIFVILNRLFIHKKKVLVFYFLTIIDTSQFTKEIVAISIIPLFTTNNL